MPKTKPKPDDPVQFARFKEAAEAAGVGADAPATLDRAFMKVAPEKRAPRSGPPTPE